MIPIYNIINYTGNRYLLSKAVMMRARQINFVGDEELGQFHGKIVSLSMKQVLADDIKFCLPEEESPEES